MSVFGGYGDSIMDALIAAAQEGQAMSALEAVEALELDLADSTRDVLASTVDDALGNLSYLGTEDAVWTGDEGDDEES